MHEELSGYSIAIVASISVSAMLAAGQAVLPAKQQRNWFLVAIYSILAVSQTHALFLTTGWMSDIPLVYRTHIPTLFCIGPLLYFLYQTVFEDEIELDWYLILHFAPAILLAAFNVFDLLGPRMILGRYHLKVAGQGDPTDFLLLASLVHILVYVVYMFLRLQPFKKEEQGGRRQFEKKVMSIIAAVGGIAMLVSIVAAILAGMDALSIFWARFTAMNGSVLLIAIYLVTQRYPNFFQNLEEKLRQEKYQQSYLQNVDLKETAKKLKELMEEEKIYRQEKLTAKELADEAGLSSHQLSEFLSTQMNMRFFHYVNRYRIEEACQKLIGEPEKDILTIAYEVGFNTKATFQAAFAREQNMTPGTYRKTHSAA